MSMKQIVLTGLLAASLSNCTWLDNTFGSTRPATTSPAAAAPEAAGQRQGSPVMNFVTSNAVGAEAPLDDPYFGGEVIVRVDQEYVSAAGRQCRRFHARSVRQGDAGQPFHACVVDNAWVLVGVY